MGVPVRLSQHGEYGQRAQSSPDASSLVQTRANTQRKTHVHLLVSSVRLCRRCRHVNVRCTADVKQCVNGRRDVCVSAHGVIPGRVSFFQSGASNLLPQGSHTFFSIHVATHACFLRFCMFDIAEHPKRTLAMCLPVAAIASFASEPMEPVQAPSQLLRCTANSLS